jgi:hypothetical protein
MADRFNTISHNKLFKLSLIYFLGQPCSNLALSCEDHKPKKPPITKDTGINTKGLDNEMLNNTGCTNWSGVCNK